MVHVYILALGIVLGEVGTRFPIGIQEPNSLLLVDKAIDVRKSGKWKVWCVCVCVCVRLEQRFQVKKGKRRRRVKIILTMDMT